VRYPDDDFVAAVATDAPDRLPVPTQLPVLDLNQPAQVAQWLLAQGERFEYHWDLHGGLL
jgi:molybdopterin-guanine dinucleotide biosynthesis protein B